MFAIKIGCEINSKDLKVTAAQNPDKSIALVVFNPTEQSHSIEISISNYNKIISISAKALQTVVIDF